jgi:hypothetical protein
MVTRDYPEYAQQVRPGGGPDRQHMYVGEDHGTVCWNTGSTACRKRSRT